MVKSEVFGDDVNGKAPLAGQTGVVKYRIGGGSRGRIGTGIIDSSFDLSPEEPATASVKVMFRNISPSSGGYDAETIDQAKKRAPKQWATHENIVTAADYVDLSSIFNHPVYGGVAKAVATIYTSINANIVKVSILAEGEGGKPVDPNVGLKDGLRNFLNKYNVLTDDVEVNGGKIKPIDVEIVVVLYENAEVGSAREQIDRVVDDFFDLKNWNMGQPLYVSLLYEQIMSINWVKLVNIFNPHDDILPQKDVGDQVESVDFDELITLGNKNIKVYYEQ